jgi:hypothetical protein
MFRKKNLIFVSLLLLGVNTPLFCQVNYSPSFLDNQNQPQPLDVPAPPEFDSTLPFTVKETTIINPTNNKSETVYVVSQKQEAIVSSYKAPFGYGSVWTDDLESATVNFYYSIPKPPATTSNLLRVVAPGASDGSFTGDDQRNGTTTWRYIIDSNGFSKLATVDTVDKSQKVLYTWGKTKEHDGTFTFTLKADQTGTQRKTPFNEFKYINLAKNGVVKVRLPSERLEFQSINIQLFPDRKFSNPWVEGDSLSKPLSEAELKIITSKLPASLTEKNVLQTKPQEKIAEPNLQLKK